MVKCPHCSSKYFDSYDIPTINLQFDYFNENYIAHITLYIRCAECRVVSRHIVEKTMSESDVIKFIKNV